MLNVHIFKVLETEEYKLFWVDELGYGHSFYFASYAEALAFKCGLLGDLRGAA